MAFPVFRPVKVSNTSSYGSPSTLTSMLAVVWHFWIAPALAVATILAIVASVGGYLSQVTRKRYPRD